MDDDIFEEMRQRLNCEYISDIRNLKKEVFQELHRISLDRYTNRQLEDFANYVFRLRYLEMKKLLYR